MCCLKRVTGPRMSKQCYNRLTPSFCLTLTINCYENTVMSMSIQLTKQPQIANAVFAVVVNNGQQRVFVTQQAFTLPEEHFGNTRLENRFAQQEPDRQTQTTMSNLQITFDFKSEFDQSSMLQEALKSFVNGFLPTLKDKPIQLRAELANLEHISSCSEHMLKPVAEGGLGFKPEFVAQIVRQRLQIAMFVDNQLKADIVEQNQVRQPDEKLEDIVIEIKPESSGGINIEISDSNEINIEIDNPVLQPAEKLENIVTEIKQESSGGINIEISDPNEINIEIEEHKKYLPACMFDFGEARAEVKLGPTDQYAKSGQVQSPRAGAQQHGFNGSNFSFVRGDGIETYTMPNGKSTTNLPARFRQSLQFQVQQIGGEWEEFNQSTPLTKLPPAMQFLVGLQFGQINVGTWNPFTLAAKKYFALQTDGVVDQFFWKDTIPQLQQTHDAMLLETFGELMTTLGIQQQQHQLVAQQFELGLIAYYAMNMEILSRVDFDGNDMKSCQMKQIYRFEGLEALEPIGAVSQIQTQGQQQLVQYQAQQHIPTTSKRSVIVSSSATMFATSVDKPAMFPPPIKVITCYQNVHHARVFGTHLFNVDFANAERKVLQCVQKFKNDKFSDEIYKYDGGCPFFQDRQRELLLMSVGIVAQIDSVLCYAPDKKNCFVLTKGEDNLQQRIAEHNLKPEKLFQFTFCAGQDINKLQAQIYIEDVSNNTHVLTASQKQKLLEYQKQLMSIIDKFEFKHVTKK